jgi:site-specific DNA recombinase
MKSCFGYVRVSTMKQGEGVSLEAQREAILAFAERNDLTICKWFEEKETAAKSGRPVFNGMIKALRRGKADGLVVHKIDRSARNFSDWAKIGDLADSGIDVYFATETLDFRSRGGRLSADIQAVIAADYVRNLRDETKKGITGRLKQGLYPFKAPIGYLNNGGGKPKTPDPINAPFVRLAFELYESREHSLRSLGLELKNRGFCGQNGKPLSKHGIELLLGNCFYCGVIKIKKTGAVYQGIHEPIVSRSLFDTVQEIRTGKSGKKVSKHNHLFRGLFRCQHCELAMIPELQKGHVYYRCHTRLCTTKTVREEALESVIVGALTKVKISDDDIIALGRKIDAETHTQAHDNKLRSAKLQLAQIDERLDRLTDALVDHHIDGQAFAKRKERLISERSRLVEMVESIIKLPNPQDLRKFLELLKNLGTLYYSSQPREKRQIVQLATSNRNISGKYIWLEPANWLATAENAIRGLIGDPSRPTSRTSPEMREQHVATLKDQILIPECTKLRELVEPRSENSI